MLGAETHVGDMGFELLQPLEGPSIYREWLDEHGEGLHHFAVMRHLRGVRELKRRFSEIGRASSCAAGSARRSSTTTSTPSPR